MSVASGQSVSDDDDWRWPLTMCVFSLATRPRHLRHHDHHPEHSVFREAKRVEARPPHRRRVTALHLIAVTNADFDGDAGTLLATFDVVGSLVDPLQSDPAKWTLRWNNVAYVGSGFTFDGGGRRGSRSVPWARTSART